MKYHHLFCKNSANGKIDKHDRVDLVNGDKRGGIMNKH